MKIHTIAVRNLMRKRLRSLLTLVGISLSALVLLTLLGFNRGYEASLNRDIDNLGFQVLLTAKGCPYEAATLMLKGGAGLRYVDATLADTIAARPEVEGVTPMLMQSVFDPDKGEAGGFSAYLGIDPITYPKMKGFLKFKAGKWFADPNAREVVMGYEAAELEQREIGDLIVIPDKNIELKVVGILERSGTQDDGTIFIPIQTLASAYEVQGKLTALGIKVKQDYVPQLAEFEESLYELPDVQVVSLAQVKETIINLVTTARVMVLSIALIALLIAMVGVVNTVLMSVFERFAEIGILKSMGATGGDIFRLIWTETVLLCVVGGIVGSALAWGLARGAGALIRAVLPYAPTGDLVSIDFKLALLTVGIVTLIGILSGIYPALKAAKIRPLEAIRSEVD